MVGFAAAAPSEAVEPVMKFLHAAQARGYGEVALDYLEQLRAANRVPSELSETWDLELSRSYRAAVSEAFNAQEAETRLAKAQAHLDKFLQEHADHPAVAGAMESWGDMALDSAWDHIRVAANLQDETLKQQHRAEARADLEKARPRLVDATARYGDQLAALRAEQDASSGPRPRAAALMNRQQRAAAEALRDAEMVWLDCRFKAAKVDFYLGQTYEDAKSPERKAAFKAAAKAFDDVFQSYRESLVGVHAHLWHGRSVDALGDDRLALDIYDEVLATAPDGRQRETGLEPVFASAQYHRLLVIKRTEGPQAFLAEAEDWLELRRAWKDLADYQGLALEVAKTYLDNSDQLAGSKKKLVIQAALTRLSDMARVRGPYQQEAILLHRQYTQAGAADLSTVKSFDEAVALAENAAQGLDWPAAVAAFERAFELRTSATDAGRATEAQTQFDYARYQVAAAHYAAGQFADALAAARRLMDERPDAALAPPAAALAVSAALSRYASSADKDAALAELTGLAQTTIKRWPDKPEADDARIALGQASLVRGDAQAALEVFENVNPRSLRYPSAMFLAGQTHWRLYLTSNRAGGSAEQLAAERDAAEQQLTLALEGQRAAAGDAVTRPVLETQLLLAEVVAAGGDVERASKLVEPLLGWIAANKPDSLDNMLLRVFLTAARAQMALGQSDQAAHTAELLFQLGPDEPATNGVLVSIVKSLSDYWKQAEAASIDARTSGDAAVRAQAQSDATQRKGLVAALAEKLIPRKQQSLAARIYLADTSVELDQTTTAQQLYQAILSDGENDPAFASANAAALTRIRTQLVGLIRREAKTADAFQEGLKQVDELIAAYPNALEPKMEKGRLLQAWANVDPSQLDAAVAHWTLLRTRLARARSKPPEYYQVVLGAAQCLFTDSLKTNDTQKALQAEQLLNATLVLSPRLSGPEIVAQYKELLHKARSLQGRPTAAGN